MKNTKLNFLPSMVLIVLTGCVLYPPANTEKLFQAHHNLVLESANYNGYSLRYEHFFYQKRKHRIAFNAGVSGFYGRMNIYPYQDERFYEYGLVTGLVFTTSSKNLKSHFEMGWGYEYLVGERFENVRFGSQLPPPVIKRFIGYEHYFPIRLGYRYQRPKGGLGFKVGYIPLTYFRRNYTNSTTILGKRIGGGWAYDPAGYLGIFWTFKPKKSSTPN